MVFPWIWFQAIFPSTTTGEDDGDVASIHIDDFDGHLYKVKASGVARRVVIIDNGQQAYKVKFPLSITGGTSKSALNAITNAAYTTSGTAKVILIITGSNTTVTDFEIIEDSSQDAGTGTVKEDFSNVALPAGTSITSKELSFASGKYITVKSNTGTITTVAGYIIE